MKLKVFLKYFLGFFVLLNLISVLISTLLLGKSLDEIDYMLNMFSATIFSTIVAISKARNE